MLLIFSVNLFAQNSIEEIDSKADNPDICYNDKIIRNVADDINWPGVGRYNIEYNIYYSLTDY